MAAMTGNAIREALEPIIVVLNSMEESAVEFLRRTQPDDAAGMTDAEIASLVHPDDSRCFTDGSQHKAKYITVGDLRRARTAYDAIGAGVKANWIANCVRCGRVVDTREVKDGGDKFGCELARGGWTCSFECWKAEVDAADNGAGPYGGAKADEGAVAFEFDRYINGTLMAEGVKIECQPTLEKAFKRAAQIASRGANGEVPVLVLRSPLYARPVEEPGEVEAKAALAEALENEARETAIRRKACARADAAEDALAEMRESLEKKLHLLRFDLMKAFAAEHIVRSHHVQSVDDVLSDLTGDALEASR